MAEREGFEPPIALRLCLISSQVRSTGLRHLSDPGLVYRQRGRDAIEQMQSRVNWLVSFRALPRSLRDRGSTDLKISLRYGTAQAVPLSKTRQIRRFWLRQNGGVKSVEAVRFGSIIYSASVRLQREAHEERVVAGVAVVARTAGGEGESEAGV